MKTVTHQRIVSALLFVNLYTESLRKTSAFPNLTNEKILYRISLTHGQSVAGLLYMARGSYADQKQEMQQER